MSFNLHLDVKRLLTLSVVLVSSAVLLLVASATSWAVVENGKIAFESSAVGGGGGDGDHQIFAMESNDSGPVINLTDGLDDDGKPFRSPAWSPDGTKIAFQSQLAREGYFDIYTINADGGGLKKLTACTDAEKNNENPTWSPDGSQIAFRTKCDGEQGIYVMSAEDGSGAEQVTFPEEDETDMKPAWSPDGEKIAFTRKNSDGKGDIFILTDIGGGEVENRTNSVDKHDQNSTWSPDSSKIAFQSDRGTRGKDGIYVVSADESTDLVHLTMDDRNKFVNPAWSPDGLRIAFSAQLDDDSDKEIYTIKSDGSDSEKQKVRSQSHEGDDGAPSWAIAVSEDSDDDPGPGPDNGSETPPGSSPSSPPSSPPGAPPLAGPVSVESVLFKLTNPKLKRSKVNRVKRAALYRYIKRGFKGKVSGYKSIRASLVRVVNRRVKGKAKRKKACHTLARKRTSCGKTSRKGISIKAAGTGSTFKYLPTGKSKRQLKRLKKGKRIRRGLYQLTFKAKLKTGGKTKTFRHRLKVR